MAEKILINWRSNLKKVLLYNPPGGLWLRGEARCEQDIDSATAFTVTAPTTLCYIAAIFRRHNIEPKIVDCPVEGVNNQKFLSIVKEFDPDCTILNASVLNLPNDLIAVKAIHDANPNIMQCANLPYFNSVPIAEIKPKLTRLLDIIIVGEAEAVTSDLAEHINGKITRQKIRGVILANQPSDKLVKTEPIEHIDNLDSLPLPARDLIQNKLYFRPDTGRPMASIFDGKGCPSSCIYCLAPITTGKKVRKRSVASVLEEIKQCVTCYDIRDFLFRSDTFTLPKEWVMELCQAIKDSELSISWAANSRTNTFDEETARAMKRAGCFLVEFGIESGSNHSLKLQKKGTTVQQAFAAVRAAKSARLLTYGTVLIGFPWEDAKDLNQTKGVIHQLALDFIEVQIVAPYIGTELFDIMMKEGLIDSDAVGHDMVRNPAIKGTKHLSREELVKFRKDFLHHFYINPNYVFRTLKRIKSLRHLLQYGKYGIQFLKNNLIK